MIRSQNGLTVNDRDTTSLSTTQSYAKRHFWQWQYEVPKYFVSFDTSNDDTKGSVSLSFFRVSKKLLNGIMKLNKDSQAVCLLKIQEAFSNGLGKWTLKWKVMSCLYEN